MQEGLRKRIHDKLCLGLGAEENVVEKRKNDLFYFLFIEGPRSRCYGRTAALKSYFATL
jgi:hypothetical protein